MRVRRQRIYPQGSTFLNSLTSSAKSIVLYYKQKQKRWTREKCVSELGSSHELVPATPLMVSKTIDVAWDVTYVTLQAPPVAPSASRSTREGGSPRLVPPSTPSAPRLSHCVLSDGPRSIHPLLVKTKPIKLLRRVLFLHVTRRYQKAACRKMTRFNPRL